MQSGFRIGSVFGIPLQIHPSWIVIVALLTFSNGWDWQLAYPSWGGPLAWGMGFLAALLLFGSVLLHELGHSLTARAQGIQVNSITLFLFGGIASINRESKTPGEAFQVAIAGPAVSIVLSLLLFGLATILPAQNPAQVLAAELAQINLVVALFNLIPGLPLDGGQVFKAAVWKVTGDRFKGVRWAAKSGLILGWGAIALGLFTLLAFQSGSGIWLMLLGWFGVQNAQSYSRLTTLQESLVTTKASDAMTRQFKVLDGQLSVDSFIELYFQASAQDGAKLPVPYYAATDGRYNGLLKVSALQGVERSQWQTRQLLEFAQPLSEIPSVTEEETALRVIQKMEGENLSFITVLTPAGAVAGVIDRGDLVQAVGKTLGLKFSSEDIQRIKLDGSYPSGLQLGAIAQATDP